MKRRQFLVIPFMIGISSAFSAEDTLMVDYSRDAYESALSSGQPFLLDFSATW